ncbi:AAA family ATPase [Dactylosporangium sp. NPDC005555]|uniref:bifunctional aminoglycoside phosphotransferase/ATP-binding protein n=1 Tax=Dactylosporangium sp. NPDC005555 TaxID=3154889 RepID=UPI0033AC9163
MPAETDVGSFRPAETFAEVQQTHAAVVFMVGSRAYKLKKPVDLGFLDFSTRAKRQAVCQREVELNRRLAPDVYLGVADVSGPDGAVCDHLVVMRRMPVSRRLSTLVRDGAPIDDDLRRLARLLAAFHANARRGPEISAEGSRDAIRRRWTDSFRLVATFRGRVLHDRLVEEITTLTLDFLAGRDALFADRIASGRVVDGHADLLANDIFCLDDGPRVLDCIEFDDKLRWIDGLDDAAFLAMDLEHLGRPELATQFLDWYAEFAGDPAPSSLRHHYLAYRAFVRAKVACLRHAQGDPHAAADAVQHAQLTVTHLRAGAPRLILVGGLPGTGKTTLAGRLADRLGGVVLSSDRLRKELAGVAPATSAKADFEQGIYTPAWTGRTYTALLQRADALLARGETVLLDASWSDAECRAAARAQAARTHSALIELRCAAPDEVVTDRLRRRTLSTSDADAAIATAMAARADPWPEASTIRTDMPLTPTLDELAGMMSRESARSAMTGAGTGRDNIASSG